ncbi:hypothetical protein RSOLAG1IB_08062 [Rhizoctonia solani AG-1 IB]|uniref:Uncharacterized protein n=2 Tax=Rhizoctonia solani TaxID=456999 RepID=A0A8H2WT00_9AGAM|nr:unnamed protein product [Rhizoctonia solani]CEL56760.1 hypothetical protein RSOLAG1IB_08062 [Rhizoctonia solani AG-1 IB]
MYTQYLTAPVLRVSSPLSPNRPVPSIYVSPAESPVDPNTPSLEPSSPEESMSSRSNHLLPPPVSSPHRRTLVPSKAMDKKGLDQATFQDLLAANRERSSRRLVSSADRLRREVVVKAHHSKQFERRALFLSRIIAPPSPTSTETAVTPPESPAIFHFSLPSPGLASPLELFENVSSRERWIEEVDYNKKPLRTPARDAFPTGRLPSLDQITARLRPTINVNTVPTIPSIVIESPSPVAVKPLNIIKGDNQDAAKPRSRIPNSIIASARARSTSPPTPVAPITPTCDAPSKLIIASSPPKSIKPVLVPQSIPALRINRPSGPELAPVPVMSWRQREMVRSPSVTKEHMQTESWRREVPAKKDLVRDAVVSPITPQTVMSLPVGTKPAPLMPRETRPNMMARQPEALVPTPMKGTSNMDVAGLTDGAPTVRRNALPVNAAGSEGRAAQGRNMLDKLRRRTSAPAQLEGVFRKGVPVGGF